MIFLQELVISFDHRRNFFCCRTLLLSAVSLPYLYLAVISTFFLYIHVKLEETAAAKLIQFYIQQT